MVLTQMIQMTSPSLSGPLGLQKLYCTKDWNVAYKLENVKCFFSEIFKAIYSKFGVS
jgi:hypothetical protein